MIIKKASIAIIIVTYNRLDLLKKCIQAIRNQTFKDFDIIVINNGSTDGTKEWLISQEDIEILNQENIGGSGGFHNGIKYAYDKGYDYFWIMDDDGIPDNDCLGKLFEVAKKGFHYVAPNLIDFNGKEHFANLNLTNERIVSHVGGPFNAILLSRILISQIGLPNIHYFIWGDEYEFVNRVKENFYFTVLVKNAIHRHKLTEENPKIVEKRIYYKIRNMVWSARLSNGIIESKKNRNVAVSYTIIRYAVKYIMKFRLVAVKNIIKGVRDGIKMDLCTLRAGSSI